MAKTATAAAAPTPEALNNLEFTRRADELIGVVRQWLQRTEGYEEEPALVEQYVLAVIKQRLEV